MKLQVGPNIDNTMVRLDFRKSPDKPDYTPSYIIEKSKADEFVKQYNEQETKLINITLLTSGVFAALGWLASRHKSNWLWKIFSIPAGIIAGAGIGAFISSHTKSHLMDKYDVKEMPYKR